MAKLTTTDIASLNSSAATTINNNFALVETAMENTLSRDGTTPNSMQADFDMNSNQILNLPAAVDPTDPVRLQEFEEGMDDLEQTVQSIANAAALSAAEAEGFRDETEGFKDAAAVSAAEAAASAALLEGEVALQTEAVEDIVGALVDTTTSIVATYSDATPSLTLERAALTGDISASQNSNTTTLATVNANVGTFGSATAAPQITVNGKGLVTAASDVTVTPAVGSITGLGTGVATFLATPSSANLASAVTDETGSGALVFGTAPSITNASLTTPALGTPSSGTLTNCTGLPVSTGISGLAAGVATFLATPSSANLASAVTNETGSGSLVFATSPTLVTPALGTPSSGTLTNCTGLPTAGLVDDAVTFAKMQNIATDSLIGRDTASTGDPENITLNATLSMTGSGALQRAALTGDVTASAGSNATTLVQGSASFALTGDISPTQITADQNDYNPTNLSTAAVLRLSTDAARNITGLQGGSDGRILLLHNVGSFDFTLVDESASSTAGNRFALSANVTVAQDQSVMIQYDSTSSRWRMIGGTGSGGGGGAPTTSQYLTLATDGTLTAERVLSPGNGLTGTDGGAGGNYTLAVGAGNGITVAADSVAADFAVQADQETGTSLVKVVNPGVQHYHPSACKAWVRFNSAGTVAASYNITSITDSGVGDWTVNIATDFSSANYVGVTSTPTGASGFAFPTDDFNLYVDAAGAAGTFNLGYTAFQTDSGSRADPTTPNEIHVAFFGDQ